ncbi:MAG: tRNA-dihydrouridine synthase [Epsilonproteobacteria bacterium]|nr:tRNA-dihydrouridine synthase [Campylobacterota bacterium]
MIDFQKEDLLFLAPLAGYTDLPFRALVKDFGADVTVSEMISSNALVYDSKKTLKMLEKSPNETPYIVQIAGNNEEIIKKAVLKLNEMDGIDGIDLNCGCPAPKVVKHGSGSALLKDLPKMARLIETIKKHSTKRYTSVKSRLGFDRKIPKEIVKVCEDSGADFVTLHGRTRSDGYKSDKIDYESIKEAKSFANIPVIANGDIINLSTYKKVKKITDADAVMIGRGAIGNPWIFYQIKNSLEFVKKEKIKDIVLKHFYYMREFYGDRGVALFRKHLHLYSKSFPNASNFRDKVNKINDPQELIEKIELFFD